MTAEEHRKMLETDFADVKLEDLADISRIRIDRGKAGRRGSGSICGRQEIPTW